MVAYARMWEPLLNAFAERDSRAQIAVAIQVRYVFVVYLFIYNTCLFACIKRFIWNTVSRKPFVGTSSYHSLSIWINAFGSLKIGKFGTLEHFIFTFFKNWNATRTLVPLTIIWMRTTSLWNFDRKWMVSMNTALATPHPPPKPQ